MENGFFTWVVFEEFCFSVLAYTSRTYSEALEMQRAVLYTTYTKYYHEQTGSIIAFAQFEEGYLLKNERNAEEDESVLF